MWLCLQWSYSGWSVLGVLMCLLPVCSWCLLCHRVPPRWLCGVCAEQGEGQHCCPGPQEAGSQRSVSTPVHSNVNSSMVSVRLWSTRSLDPPLEGAMLWAELLSSFLAVQLEVLESLACENSLPVPQPTCNTGISVLQDRELPVLQAWGTDILLIADWTAL